jgi:hypothetical protein
VIFVTSDQNVIFYLFGGLVLVGCLLGVAYLFLSVRVEKSTNKWLDLINKSKGELKVFLETEENIGLLTPDDFYTLISELLGNCVKYNIHKNLDYHTAISDSLDFCEDIISIYSNRVADLNNVDVHIKAVKDYYHTTLELEHLDAERLALSRGGLMNP